MRWLFWATFSETMGHTDYVSSFIPFPQGVLWGKKKKEDKTTSIMKLLLILHNFNSWDFTFRIPGYSSEHKPLDALVALMPFISLPCSP